ncbi:MAG TPA: alcohol dehydrogenase catalytic domain-containing protein [Methanolinea sp.]|jgi:L-iditol 2-dehydrogenase|nr:MAG: putative L-threonine 3-dehydrogenase [Methanoregulaceae archaeon PtaB.Bin009]OPY39484.1 MAG: putative L-threonine 3-dehydrogenase [Methanoregulaceae archaeon PtaU1.Bin066]HII75876.1 alcohol dehydrogenase catalytic domain-containing protein [Methanolinea sp.]
MKAAVYYSNSDIRIEDVDDIAVSPGEIKVKVMACGVCGSDVMEWYRIKRAGRPGGIGAFGHECTGVIEEVGSGVDPKWKVGDRVVVTHHVPCNTCNACLRGHATACETLQKTKFKNAYGAFAEYVVLPAINVDRGCLHLPESVSFDEGTFVEPLGCVVRGQRFAPTSDGRSVLILGAGITGLLHLKAARLNGAGFIAVSNPSPDRLKIARTFGADATISAKEDVPERFKELNGGSGADTVIMTAPVPVCVKQSLDAVGRGGTVLFFAPTNPEIQSGINLWNLWQKEVTITHSYAADLHDLTTALTWIKYHRIDVTDMITHVFPLRDTVEGFQITARHKEGSLKAIVHPQE